MVKKCLSLILVGTLMLLATGPAAARTSTKDETSPVEKIKTNIVKLGVGEKARAHITLRNGQKIKGYVNSAGPNDFAFTERGSGQTTTIAYSDVAEVKKPGLSTAAKIGIAAAIGIGVTALV